MPYRVWHFIIFFFIPWLDRVSHLHFGFGIAAGPSVWAGHSLPRLRAENCTVKYSLKLHLFRYSVEQYSWIEENCYGINRRLPTAKGQWAEKAHVLAGNLTSQRGGEAKQGMARLRLAYRQQIVNNIIEGNFVIIVQFIMEMLTVKKYIGSGFHLPAWISSKA